ncbi:hypothetical protein QYE76_061472 [Lolium multiflorum]|uniref:Uncharacterized protein n=1 Tax=Lolium multiflorum TaxID=4521 RepID=A0AAD8W7H7_LOLMU|nr:hypothetical protein QYE76_061472 [Lolium multiflorum]
MRCFSEVRAHCTHGVAEPVISKLEPDAKALLEASLMEANREREKRILKGTKNSLSSPTRSDDSTTILEVLFTTKSSLVTVVSWLRFSYSVWVPDPEEDEDPEAEEEEDDQDVEEDDPEAEDEDPEAEDEDPEAEEEEDDPEAEEEELDASIID